MLKPPSPQRPMTWRERSSTWMPLAWPSAVPTPQLLKEARIRCDPLCRIQLPDQSVLRPVSMMNTASRLAVSLTTRATACGWMRSRLRAGSACLSSIAFHLWRSLVTRSKNFPSLLAATSSSRSFTVGRTEPRTPSSVAARRPSARPFVDLNDRAFLRQKFRKGVVCTEHQEQIAVHDRVIDRFGSDHADAAHPAWLV